MKCWLGKRVWRRVTGRKATFDKDWASFCQEIKLLERYTPEECARLTDLAENFLERKSIEGAGGFEITSDMRRLIAVQACLPILKLGLDYYDGWYSVVVYPGEFRAPHEYVDEMGVAHRAFRELSGESWHRGPVILSWKDVEQDAKGPDRNGNVVIHEFAHKLDLLNGKANGMPPLHANMNRREWTQAFTSAFDDFQQRLALGRELPFDAYAATSPDEFFAVASEAFFVSSDPLYAIYPAVYRMLCEFYRQDPRDK